MRPSTLLLALVAVGCASAPSQTAPVQTPAPQPAAPAPAAAAAPAAAPAPDLVAGATSRPNANPFPSTYAPFPSRPTVIRNVNIFTGAGPLIRNGAILLVDGKVAAVGATVNAPAGAVVIDGQGKYVTPGLIDTHSHLGVYPAPGTAAHNDGNEATRPVTAYVWAEHSVWPQDPQFPRDLAGGTTTIQVLPGSANLIGGRSVVLKVVPSRSVQGMKFPGAPYGLKMACGENPKRVYANSGPSTRMANVAGYRSAWIEADAYRRRWDKWLAKPEGDPPGRDLNNETLAEVLRGNILVHNHCYQADEMLQMIDIAKEFGYKIRSFHHGVEAYKIADVLAREGISASIWSDWGGFKMEALDGVKANVGLTHVAGARAIVHSDDASYSQRLNQEAAKSLAAARLIGLTISDEDAIRWITINPAWALGIDRMTGSLEVGKNADLVLWSGNPLSVYTRAEKVWIDGAMLYDMSDATQRWRTDFELGYVPKFRGDPLMRATTFVRLAALLAVTAPLAGAQTVAITGGTVYPVSGPKIENGTVLIRDGKIVAVGANVAIPADAQRIDARGKWVTPGFINSATTLGLNEAGGPQFSGGYNDVSANGSNGIAASFEAWRGINPVNTYIIPARQEGVTTVAVGGGNGMISGRVGVIDLVDATTVAELFRKGPVAMAGDFGNPGNGNTGARAEYWAKWRALLNDVKAYQARKAAYEQGNTRTLAAPQSELEALIPVVSGQMPLALNVDRASDILAALAFAKEYNLKLWITSGAEGWMVAKEIAAARVPVFTGAMNNIPQDFGALGQRQENAAMLRAAGVTVVLVGNGPGDEASFNVRNIRQEAGNAVAFGLSWDEALRAITLAPAEVLGIGGEVGSIAVGRDANVVVWSGDPFEFASVAEQVFVRGRTFTSKSRQQMLVERYLTLPPAYRRP